MRASQLRPITTEKYFRFFSNAHFLCKFHMRGTLMKILNINLKTTLLCEVGNSSLRTNINLLHKDEFSAKVL